MTPIRVRRSRLLWRDVFRVGSVGLRTRRLRATLSALGIAIGIASMISVLGISESSKADLVNRLDRLGTNLLEVSAGQALFGGVAQLPVESTRAVARIGPVQRVSAVGTVNATVRKTDLVPQTQSQGISVNWVEPSLLATLGGELERGRFIDDAIGRYPVTVLGARASELLAHPRVGDLVWLGERWFTVGGVLAPLELATDLDRAALIGEEVGQSVLDADESPTTIYARTFLGSLDDVRSVLPASASPERPEEVEVSRPSDALEARAAVNDTFTALFVGLGAVALLVGGVGIANVMVISVLERRSEIGLRRALGAARRHIWGQFVSESLLLAAAGGVVGVVLGAAITAAYAWSRGWETVVPAYGLFGGVAAAIAIGAVAGAYPAMRAARLPPTEALRAG